MNIPCPRCPQPEDRPLAEALAEWVEAIPPDQRASTEERDRRLLACESCVNLYDGVCQLCGCYVALRASKARQRCPAVPPMWTGEESITD